MHGLLHSLEVGQTVPGPRCRVQDVPHNFEVAGLFHQLCGGRIDDCSAIRNLWTWTQVLSMTDSEYPGSETYRVDHDRDGLLQAV